MPQILIISLILLHLNSTTSAEQGNCHLEGVAPANWLTIYINAAVKDVERSEFKRFRYYNITSVEVQGIHYGKYFNASLLEDYVVVGPTDAFNNYERDEDSHSNHEMNVYLIFECTNGHNKRLAFYQPINDTNTYSPEFNRSSYTYKLPMPLPADFSLAAFGDQIEACDLDISNTRLNFAVNSSEDIFLTWEKPSNETYKCHLATLKTKRYLRLGSNQDYEIVVTDIGVPAKSNVAILHIEIDEQKTIPPNPKFEHVYYTAIYNCNNNQHSIAMNGSIRLEADYPNIVFNIFGEYGEHFLITAVSDTVVIHLKQKLPEDVLTNNAIIFITIEAVIENAEESGQTVLTIEFSPECSFIIDYISFDQDNYWFEVNTAQKVLIGIVAATVFPQQRVLYSLEDVNYTKIPQYIEYNRNTGEVTVSGTIPEGLYNFIAVADGLTSKIQAKTSVVINISKHYIATKSVASLIAVHILENTEGIITLPCEDVTGACEYEVVEQYPPTSPMLFNFHESHLHIVGINREMDEIADMTVPQFLVRMRLTAICLWSGPRNEVAANATHSASKRKAFRYEENREWVYIPATVTIEPEDVLVAVIVDDVNDNPPIFDDGDCLIIGYPARDLVAKIEPPYLVKVRATDLDVGINAYITYSTNSTHVVIHPKTGVIYPKESMFDNEANLKFIVTATDINENSFGSLSSNLEIEVKLLQDNHLAVLIINNTVLEDLDTLIQMLTKKTNLKIKILTAAVVPNTCTLKNSETEQETATSQHVLRAIIYGFDSHSEPVPTEELQKSIKSCGILKDFTIEKLSCLFDNPVTEDDGTKCDSIHFIIVIAVMSSLLMIVTTVSGIVFYVKIYRQSSCNNKAGLRNINMDSVKVGPSTMPNSEVRG